MTNLAYVATHSMPLGALHAGRNSMAQAAAQDIPALQQEIDNLKQEIAQVKRKIEDVKQQIDAARGSALPCEEQLAGLQRQLDRSEELELTLQEQLATLHRRLERQEGAGFCRAGMACQCLQLGSRPRHHQCQAAPACATARGCCVMLLHPVLAVFGLNPCCAPCPCALACTFHLPPAVAPSTCTAAAAATAGGLLG